LVVYVYMQSTDPIAYDTVRKNDVEKSA
jgi:hypothetical protein